MMNMNNKVNAYFTSRKIREEQAKETELREMVKTFGIDTVIKVFTDYLMETEKVSEKEINNQVNEAKNIIPWTKYGFTQKWNNGKYTCRPVEFGDETKKVLDQVLAETGTELWVKGEGTSKRGKITNKGFASYVIAASGNSPQVLIDIINILKNAVWDNGHGITAEKMEIVYHALVLHYGQRERVIDIITGFLKDYDLRSLEVTSNQDERYRNHLSYKQKMMMLVEDKVCEQIGEQPMFAREIA